jgi:hypothetical protein
MAPLKASFKLYPQRRGEIAKRKYNEFLLYLVIAKSQGDPPKKVSLG